MENYSIGENIPVEIDKIFECYPPLLRNLLFYRGIKTREEAEIFLNPDFERDTFDPFLIKDMEKAVKRILKAIKKNEKMVIYSDYDADGIPGAVILHDFFKKVGFDNFTNYIPHRNNEGYGLNVSAIEKFADDNVKLLITVDCGITDFLEVERASELGLDVIVTDHHLVDGGKPKAFAILNSKQDDDDYPDDMLCGAGVVFKLVQALIKKGKFDLKEGWEKWLLDMVGVSTVADMVPLVKENRVLAYFGLFVLRKSPRLGLKKLLRKIKLDQKNITEDDIGFMLAPRVNVASRVDDPILAFNLLATCSDNEAGELAGCLDKLNTSRKALVASVVRKAKAQLKERGGGEVVVIGNPSWNPGILGLVASSLVEAYKKPAFVWGRDGKGEIKGSCRSDGVCDVFGLMKGVSGNVFLHTGGHKMAGGFCVSATGVHSLEEGLCEGFRLLEAKFGAAENPNPPEKAFIDKKLSLDDITWENQRLINKLAPFGVGNPKPLFLFEDIKIEEVSVFGKQKNHLKLIFKNSRGNKISAIKFFADSDISDRKIKNKKLKEGNKISLVANIEKSTFGGRIELRLRVVDLS
ncbi:single-stranded-DNA-specific exonuclease RecJ [Patescibacteria group bacterium]